LSISQKALGMLPDDGNVKPKNVGINSWCICWFSRIFLLEILIFKGVTALRLYKSFGVKEFNSRAANYVLGCDKAWCVCSFLKKLM
jgi:hypothetical protein